MNKLNNTQKFYKVPFPTDSINDTFVINLEEERATLSGPNPDGSASFILQVPREALAQIKHIEVYLNRRDIKSELIHVADDGKEAYALFRQWYTGELQRSMAPQRKYFNIEYDGVHYSDAVRVCNMVIFDGGSKCVELTDALLGIPSLIIEDKNTPAFKTGRDVEKDTESQRIDALTASVGDNIPESSDEDNYWVDNNPLD